jgi:hypothetical protein
VLTASGLTSWQAAENIQTTFPFEWGSQWSLPGDSAFSYHPQTVITKAKMQALLLGAVTIEAAEFFAYLPEVEACPWLNDVATNTGAGVTESLGVMFAKVAWEFGRHLLNHLSCVDCQIMCSFIGCCHIT